MLSGRFARSGAPTHVGRHFKRHGNGRCRPVTRGDRRRDQAGRQHHRHQLRISARHREDGIQFQSDGERLDLVGARAAIMKLRDDPAAASSMAAVLTQSNSFKLTGKIGRRPTDGELYMAHFMGVGGAAKLISNAEDNPQASGARLFPNAAAANRSIFYDHSGRARSVSQVYSVLTSRYASAANSPATRTAMAAVGNTPTRLTFASAAPSTPPIDNAAYLSSFPDVRPVTPVTMASASSRTNTSPPSDPIFRSLFQGGERAQPVSPAVRQLWGNSSSLTSVASATSVTIAASVLPLSAQTPNVRAPQPLDLFSDRSGTFSS